MHDFKAEKLRNIRKKFSITQMELASMLGVSDRAVSKWEKGISAPSSKHMLLLGKIFNISVEYFFSDDENKNKLKSDEGMESLTQLYKIGRGPSSSHTIGPEKACMIFKNKNVDADEYKVILYGSLSKTGKGHGTDTVIRKTLSPHKCEVEFQYS